jgi:hypothetical protein
MQTRSITTIPVHAARRACVELELRRSAVRGDRGQGTVEYVALILLVGAILSAVVASGAGQHFNIAKTIGNKLSTVINTVGDGKK